MKSSVIRVMFQAMNRSCAWNCQMRNCFLIIFFLSGHLVFAQVPKHIGNFTLFQQYYNPALMAYDNSAVKLLYRNQFAGFEGAPRSVLLSGELDLLDLQLLHSKNRHVSELNFHRRRQQQGLHAVGLSLWHDSFGAFTETQINANYSARVSLTSKVALRAGGVLSYNINRLNTAMLDFEDPSDQVYNYATSGSYNAQRLDVNVGLALTHENFYFAYALQNLVREGLYSGNDFLKGTISRRHIFQAGARKSVSETITVIANGLFNYDEFQLASFDLQAKSLFMKTCWVGIGYRQRAAYTMSAGFVLRKFIITYLYELPAGHASKLSNQTHEIGLTFDLIQVQPETWRQRRDVIVW